MNKTTSDTAKVPQNPQFLTLLTSKRASRHNSGAFFRQRIALESPKSGPNPRCFVRFHFQMCFAPQPRALFRRLSFQKWPGRCKFSSLIWPAGYAPAAFASLLFDPPEPQSIWKNTVFQCFATVLPFGAPASSLF